MMFRPLRDTRGIHRRLGPRGNDDVVGLELRITIDTFHADLVRAHKSPGPLDELHAVSLQLVLDDADFILHHVLDAEVQVRHGDAVFVAVICTIEILVVETGEMQDRFAHRLAGNRSRLDAYPSHGRLPLDHRNPFACFGPLDGCSLAAWPGANHH
jgi:hypothetical protein